MSSRGAGAPGAPGRPAGGPVGGPGVLALLGLAVVAQLVVLYSPDGGGAPLFPQADTAVHLLVVLVPVALAVLAGFRRRVVLAVFGAQAVLSEVVQAVLLPHRSGDPWDVVADLTGVALGVLVGTALLRRWPRSTRERG